MTFELHYLDANLAEQIEIVTMNGLTPVLTVATNIRFIQCMHIITAGTNKAAVGTINATNSAIVYGQIAAGSRRCTSSARMVPAGKVLYVLGAGAGSVSGTATARTEVKLSSTYFDGHDLTSQGVRMPFATVCLQDGSQFFNFPTPLGPFPAGTIVLMEASTDKAAIITGDWFGYLENA